MKISVYIHRDRVDVLETFGNLNDVVNKMLDLADEGLIDIEDKPECEHREGASRFNINITNENYLQMLEIYGIKSKKISLRRLIYWFVDNEIYNEVGWEPKNDYIDHFDKRLNKLVDDVIERLDKLLIFCSGNVMQNNVELVKEAKELIQECKR